MEINLLLYFEGHCLLFPAADGTKSSLDTDQKGLNISDHETPHNFVQVVEQLFDIARPTVALTRTLLSLTSVCKTFQIGVSGFMCIRSVTSRIASNKISNSKTHLLSLRIC
jgi:hypothetical protein